MNFQWSYNAFELWKVLIALRSTSSFVHHSHSWFGFIRSLFVSKVLRKKEEEKIEKKRKMYSCSYVILGWWLFFAQFFFKFEKWSEKLFYGVTRARPFSIIIISTIDMIMIMRLFYLYIWFSFCQTQAHLTRLNDGSFLKLPPIECVFFWIYWRNFRPLLACVYFRKVNEHGINVNVLSSSQKSPSTR